MIKDRLYPTISFGQNRNFVIQRVDLRPFSPTQDKVREHIYSRQWILVILRISELQRVFLSDLTLTAHTTCECTRSKQTYVEICDPIYILSVVFRWQLRTVYRPTRWLASLCFLVDASSPVSLCFRLHRSVLYVVLETNQSGVLRLWLIVLAVTEIHK